MMASAGAYYCPTIVTRYNILHLADPALSWMRAKAKPGDLDGKRRAIGHGVSICASIDSSPPEDPMQ